jgi:predicted PurR-regulated permease PerM
MTLFGINGFVIGPLVAALFTAAWEIFAASKERDDIRGDTDPGP